MRMQETPTCHERSSERCSLFRIGLKLVEDVDGLRNSGNWEASVVQRILRIFSRMCPPVSNELFNSVQNILLHYLTIVKESDNVTGTSWQEQSEQKAFRQILELCLLRGDLELSIKQTISDNKLSRGFQIYSIKKTVKVFPRSTVKNICNAAACTNKAKCKAKNDGCALRNPSKCIEAKLGCPEGHCKYMNGKCQPLQNSGRVCSSKPQCLSSGVLKYCIPNSDLTGCVEDTNYCQASQCSTADSSVTCVLSNGRCERPKIVNPPYPTQQDISFANANYSHPSVFETFPQDLHRVPHAFSGTPARVFAFINNGKSKYHLIYVDIKG
jgi:hypothetical protein